MEGVDPYATLTPPEYDAVQDVFRTYLTESIPSAVRETASNVVEFPGKVLDAVSSLPDRVGGALKTGWLYLIGGVAVIGAVALITLAVVNKATR